MSIVREGEAELTRIVLFPFDSTTTAAANNEVFLSIVSGVGFPSGGERILHLSRVAPLSPGFVTSSLLYSLSLSSFAHYNYSGILLGKEVAR